ncbi:MAG: Ykof family thiamine-binding protein [Lachnospiraceae bacterium]|nr:Ykof family thiamine-binding protein [Lachnospiraceae bacterium]
MQTNHYPWKGCGTDKDITGCRFSLSVMSDHYVEQILNGLQQVNLSKVWHHTDALSTIYRGKRIHVVDAVKACFVEMNDESTHITLEACFSKGCPGDLDEDHVLARDDNTVNNRIRHFPVLCKIAFYPLGVEDYMDHIAYIVRLAMEKGLYKNVSHYASELQGDVNALFDYFNDVLAYAEKNINHYVLQVTLSINSPTKEDN